MLPEKIAKALNEIDAKREPIDELISGLIDSLKKSEAGEAPSIEWIAERMAFTFCENYNWSRWDGSGWGTYYGPLMVSSNEDGSVSIAPSIDKVTVGIIDYWRKRAKEVTHPVLRARYAGLAWDFAKNIKTFRPDPEMAKILIDSNLELSNLNLYPHAIYIIPKLSYSLKTAIEIKDSTE